MNTRLQCGDGSPLITDSNGKLRSENEVSKLGHGVLGTVREKKSLNMNKGCRKKSLNIFFFGN